MTQTARNNTRLPRLLTGRSLDLLWRTLCSLLACHSSGLSLCCGGCELRLLGLLGACGSSLLLLALLDSSSACGRPGLRAHAPSLLDNVERGTDDGTLGLDCAAGSLLGYFLFVRVTLAHGLECVYLPGQDGGSRTSEIPFLCCLRKRTVQAMRRGFLR